LRTYTADTKKNSLAEVVAMREEKEREIDAKREYLEMMSGVAYGKVTVAGAMQAAFDHQEYVKAEIENLSRRRDQIAEIERVKRMEYTDALKEVKVLEKLKDKQRELFAAGLAREERIFFDEVAQRTHFLRE
jgi:flagellar export protein FliJ